MAERGGIGIEKKVRGMEGGRRERSGSESSASSLNLWMKRKRDGDGGRRMRRSDSQRAGRRRGR